MSAEVLRSAVAQACREIGVDATDLLRRADRVVLMVERREVQERLAQLATQSPFPVTEVLRLEALRAIIDAKLEALR